MKTLVVNLIYKSATKNYYRYELEDPNEDSPISTLYIHKDVGPNPGEIQITVEDVSQ